MKVSARSPAVNIPNLDKVADPVVLEAFKSVARIIEGLKKDFVVTINFNEIEYVSQNARPTPEEGRTVVWKDADAPAGQPQSYIVTTQGGFTWTYRSVEVV